MAYDTQTFSEDTLRALGLNDAGIRSASFVVYVTRRSGRDSHRVTAARYTTAADANDAVQAHLAAGSWPAVAVWWSGDCEPVRHWAPMPPAGYRYGD